MKTRKNEEKKLDLRKYIVQNAVRTVFRCLELGILAGAAIIGLHLNA